jgi:hypothetical protein
MLLFAHLGTALFTARFLRRADLAFIALGSMLPDIIDKPLGTIIYGTPSMGRIYAHTLLFLFLLAAIASNRRSTRLTSLSGGVTIHLLLDLMWRSPVILLWPLLGAFPLAPQIDSFSYLQMLLMGLKNPVIMMPECLGLVYVLCLGYKMMPAFTARAGPLLAHRKDGIVALLQALLKSI